MSLATSTAFQLPAAVQSRAFLVLGMLATSDVDDDLVYQMLVAFKTALGQSLETDTTTVICMLRCICKIVPALDEDSGYLCHLFWLAVALLQSSYPAFYAEAADLMCATIETLEKHGSIIPQALLESRTMLEDTISELDHLLHLSFESSFSFSLAAIIFKGVRHNHLKSSAEMVLRTLLSVTVRCNPEQLNGSLCQDALGYFVALIPFSTTRDSYVRLLRDCHAEEFLQSTTDLHEHTFVPHVPIHMLNANSDSALLLVTFATTMLNTAQGDDAETEMLYNLLLDVGITHPELIRIMYVINVRICKFVSLMTILVMNGCRTRSRMSLQILATLLSSRLYQTFSEYLKIASARRLWVGVRILRLPLRTKGSDLNS